MSVQQNGKNSTPSKHEVSSATQCCAQQPMMFAWNRELNAKDAIPSCFSTAQFGGSYATSTNLSHGKSDASWSGS